MDTNRKQQQYDKTMRYPEYSHCHILLILTVAIARRALSLITTDVVAGLLVGDAGCAWYGAVGGAASPAKNDSQK
ncbi:MAG: hypothetical protein KZQ99_21510 [Candidatus Thiodiazotropha sp. (ex Dulcina madagascariensis)]|nr:hypothetical protein [Candidatus Thiodiazotropha sp. (ex Dulcina madagascariensis)]